LSAVSSDSASRDRESSLSVDVVALGAPELRGLLEIHPLAVDAGAQVALAAHGFQLLLVLALPPPHERCQEGQALPRAARHEGLHHLLDALTLHARVAVGTVLDPEPREQQSQVVVDLGNGRHRGARVRTGAALLDGDRRREAVDRVDVGLLHLPEELPSVSRERLDVAALPLGVEGVEGER